MGMPRNVAASSTVMPRSTSTSMPLMVNVGTAFSLMNQYGLGLTDFQTCPALQALRRLDLVRLVFFAEDRFRRTHPHAGMAAVADRLVDFVNDQLFADLRRAALLSDMRDVLVPEVAQGRQHWIRRSLAEPAQRCLFDHPAGVVEEFQILLSSLTRRDAV